MKRIDISNFDISNFDADADCSFWSEPVCFQHKGFDVESYTVVGASTVLVFYICIGGEALHVCPIFYLSDVELMRYFNHSRDFLGRGVPLPKRFYKLVAKMLDRFIEENLYIPSKAA